MFAPGACPPVLTNYLRVGALFAGMSWGAIRMPYLTNKVEKENEEKAAYAEAQKKKKELEDAAKLAELKASGKWVDPSLSSQARPVMNDKGDFDIAEFNRRVNLLQGKK